MVSLDIYFSCSNSFKVIFIESLDTLHYRIVVVLRGGIDILHERLCCRACAICGCVETTTVSHAVISARVCHKDGLCSALVATGEDSA